MTTQQIRQPHARGRDRRAMTTEAKKTAFLAAFAECGRITKAAAIIRVNRGSHYIWMGADAAYAKAFDELRERVTDLLEDEAIRRAVEGIEEPLIGRIGKDKDGVVAHVTRYSDQLLALLLRANSPRYRERHELTGKDGGPIEVSAADRLEQIVAILALARARRDATPGERS